MVDYLTLSVNLKQDDYHKYQLHIPTTKEWGEGNTVDLNLEKRYVATVIDKNRSGAKDVVIVYEIDLNLNTWKEIGHLKKKNNIG